ncbi:MAG: mechanosensitive ion channel family protein [Marinibacterium sp.]|nr:mechanosensitive ion channel family protein [Marinibacterium sp.]
MHPIISRCLVLVLVLCVGLAAPGRASEEAPPEDGAATPAPQVTALADPSISRHDLVLRILPLTVDEVGQLADEWQGIVQQQTQAVVAEQLAIRAAGGAGPSRAELTRLIDQRDKGLSKFIAVVDSLEQKGGDAAQVKQYRDYRSAILIGEAQASDWRTLVARAADWVRAPDGGAQLVMRIAVIGAAFLALLIVARVVRGFAGRAADRIPQLSGLMRAFLVKTAYWLTFAVGLLIVLGALGVNIGPLFALLGGASFILAFAMQDTLGNLAAGLMIMFNRPFDVGDYVTVAGTSGTVQSVSVVSTTVTTPDNQVIVIPNSKVWGDIITNVTASDTRRVDLVFGIGYGDSIEDAQRVLAEQVAAHPLTLDDPAPMIRVSELADSSVNLICRPWARTEDYWTVYWDLMRDVKIAFDKAGISIPFPQTDMHLHVQGAAPQVLAGATTGATTGTEGKTGA